MPDLERVQQLTPFTLSQQWYESGVAVDPGTVTLGITRADGTVLLAPGQATSGATTAARTFNLTTAHTALLDTLTVTWTSTLKGTLISYVEVAGGFLFTIAALSAKVTGFTTPELVEMRATVENEIEKACSRAFVPRYALHAVDGTGDCEVRLRRKVRAIRTVTLNGATVDASTIVPTVIGAYYPAGWRWGVGNYVVGYEHGYDFTPPGVARAALILAKTWLEGQRSPIDDRAITFSAENGQSYSLAVPGRGGSLFGIPDVDAPLGRYRSRVSVA